MVRLLVASYSIMVEIAVWLMFALAAIGGYNAMGAPGLVVGVISAFLVGVFVIAPVSMLDDIRKSVVRMAPVADKSVTVLAGAGEGSKHQSSAKKPSNAVSPLTAPVAVDLDPGTPHSYKDKTIYEKDGKFVVDGVSHKSLAWAKKKVDRSS